MGRLVVASLQVLLCINDGSDDWKSFYHQGNARRSFLWRTSPSPRHWARRIWAHLSDRGRSITNLSRVIQISVYSSYSCIATSKFCLTVLPYQSSKQMAINVMSEVFRKFSGLYAPLTVHELQTPKSELSYVLNNCGLRLQRSQPFSRSCSAFWERRVVSWTLTLDFLRLQTPNSELQYHMFYMIVVYTYSTTQTAIPPELLCILG